MVMTQESIEKAKIRALSQGVKVLVLEPGVRYAVPSCSTDGACYEVTVRHADISCNCKAGQNGRACKHIAAVMMRVEAEGNLANLEQERSPDLAPGLEEWEGSTGPEAGYEAMRAEEFARNAYDQRLADACLERSVPPGYESRADFESKLADLF